MASGRSDELLMTLAQQHQSIESVLETFFEFLYRKTDFYAVSENPAAIKMGFLPGHAEEMVFFGPIPYFEHHRCNVYDYYGCSRYIIRS